jgi:hypothetical protein
MADDHMRELRRLMPSIVDGRHVARGFRLDGIVEPEGPPLIMESDRERALIHLEVTIGALLRVAGHLALHDIATSDAVQAYIALRQMVRAPVGTFPFDAKKEGE